MSSRPGRETELWGGLFAKAEAIDASDASIVELKAHLLAIEEGLAVGVDPAEDFPAYASLALCRSIRRKLEQIDPRPLDANR